MSRGKVGRPPAGKNGSKTSEYPQVSVRVPPTLLKKYRARAKAYGFPSVGKSLLAHMRDWTVS